MLHHVAQNKAVNMRLGKENLCKLSSVNISSLVNKFLRKIKQIQKKNSFFHRLIFDFERFPTYKNIAYKKKYY